MASTKQDFDFPSYASEIVYENENPISLFSNQNPVNGFMLNDGSSLDSSSSYLGEEANKYSNPILRYISGILMDEEDDLEHQPCMLQDCLALQAAEKSFYDVLDASNHPPSSSTSSSSHHAQSPEESNSSYSSTDRSSESDWSSSLRPEVAISDPFTATRTFGYVQYGESEIPTLEISGSREKRSFHLDDEDVEGRGRKLSAVNSEDSELSKVFDDVLHCIGAPNQSNICDSAFEPSSSSSSSKDGKTKLKTKPAKSSKKGANNNETAVDLWTMLIQCAQAVANYDQRNASDLLKQIRQHSSPFGDGMQRFANYFGNGLETRFSASGTPSSYMALNSNEASSSAADALKAYKLYITVTPFQRLTNFISNKMLLKEMENDCPHITTLHVIDFGIYYGFQWPCLIQHLSHRAKGGGSPIKLRLTGIDFPQPGFRPAQRIEETGRRLANYCKKYNVLFEYNCIAQKWDTIKIEDLKINRSESEMTVVNSMYRMKNLPDESVSLDVDCPRDAVLKLIRKIKPNIFIHGIANGTYNAPFFLTRFKEAMFHFSSMFDMFEGNNVGREDPQRVMFEREILGRNAMNVIACEGAERFERPETYKQWQVRNKRAGFKQISLEKEHLNKSKEFVKMEYHKNFVVDEDGKWILLGWKGRILYAISCWKPA